MTTLQDTPRASRLHIGLFGRRNSGKSSLLNALIGQSLAVVSEKPGTTTDPVYKSMEIAGIGPVVFIDTAGFDDDEAELGAARVQQTERAAAETDIALVLFQPTADESAGGDDEELAWVRRFQNEGKPVLAVVSQADTLKDDGHARKEAILQATGCMTLAVSAKAKSAENDVSFDAAGFFAATMRNACESVMMRDGGSVIAASAASMQSVVQLMTSACLSRSSRSVCTCGRMRRPFGAWMSCGMTRSTTAFVSGATRSPVMERSR